MAKKTIDSKVWKGEEFECTLDFKDGTIGIKNAVRVAEKDFRKL